MTVARRDPEPLLAHATQNGIALQLTGCVPVGMSLLRRCCDSAATRGEASCHGKKRGGSRRGRA